MKYKYLYLVMFLLIYQFTIGQQVPREEVLLEYFTGTACGACPGAAMGADDLLANGQNVAVIAYHLQGDVFENSFSLARQYFYYVTALPTAIFDGDLWHVGGDHYISLYDIYLPMYEQSISVLSDFSLDVEGVNSQLTDYVIDITVEKVATNNSQNLKLMVALTESDIPYYWMDQDYVSHVERLMFPDADGTPLDFSNGNTLDFSFSFSLDPEWVQENCELIVWVQDISTKVVHQTIKRQLDEFGGFPENDVMVKKIYTPVTMCNTYFEPGIEVTNIGSDNLTSLDLVYKIDNEPEQTYNWTGNIPYSESEIIDLPGIDYLFLNSASFSVHLENPNGQADEFPYNNMLSTTILEAENVGSPIILVLKLDDFPEQTSWEVMGSDGVVLYSGGNYSDPGVFVTETFDFWENNCYTFKIYDSEGNGLASTGLYKLMYGNTIFQTGKEFGFMDEVEFGVDITDLQEVTTGNNILVYPNPVSDLLNIETNNFYNVDIFDLNGKAVSTHSVSNNSLQVDVSNMPIGIYYLRFSDGNNVEFRKIVITSR